MPGCSPGLTKAKQLGDVCECVCADFVPLKMHHQETEPSNTNPIFLMIQIALALAVPKSPLPECLALNPLCNPASRPS